jgi:Holliday junction DNA helicase RuvA
MIAYLHGVMTAKSTERIVVDVHGVGYQALIPLSTYYALPEAQELVTLWTTMYVREDVMRLYGFVTLAEQALFELLISVSSIGPRLALNMLSSLTPADLQQAIAQGALTRLQGIPGVGRKTAERLVVELKDKMALLDTSSTPTALTGDIEDEQVSRDVISALLNLGYRRQEAEKAVKAVQPAEAGPVTLQGLLKDALQWLAR